jgi:glycosyltransferase involved in cell wall biosynthesis
MSVPKFSVIIPTLQRGINRGRAVVGPSRHTTLQEVMSVDDGSTDETAATVAAFGNAYGICSGPVIRGP